MSKSIFLAFSISNSSVTEYFLELANELSKTRSVYIFTDKLLEHPFDVSPEITFYSWPSPRPNKPQDFIFLMRRIRKHRPDTMLSMFGNVNIFLLTGFLMRVPKRIAWCHSISTAFEKSRAMEIRKAAVFRLATKLVANSDATKQDLIKNFSVNPNKIAVVYNAVRANPIPDVAVDPDKIVFVGRLHPSKGIDTLIDALAILVSEFPKLNLTIIGGHLGGNVIKKYQQQVTGLAVERNVTFLGNCEKQRVLEEFANAYVSVIPSTAEGFGLVIIESFSVKTPVIGANNSAIREIIRHEHDGLLFTTRDSADLASKLRFLLQNPDLRDIYSKQCYERFSENFELTSAVANLLNKSGVL